MEKLKRNILFVFLLFCAIRSFAQNKDSLIHALLLNIASMQVTQNGEFYAGMFPGFRQCAGAPHNYQPDNNIFYTAIGSFTLRNMLPYLASDDKKIAETIITNARKAYPLYRNKHGYPYYAFWANGDPILPHSYINKLKQVFNKGDDADDAVMILMTDSAIDKDIAALKKGMEDVSNLATPGRKITSTYNRYKNIPAYSTYLGSRTAPDFDFAVQCNLLYFVLDKKLPFAKHDSATLRLITEMVCNREYMTSPVFLSPYYVRSSVLIYHIARLISAFHIPELEVYKQQIIQDAQQEFDKSPNVMEKILLSTSLMRLGAKPELPPFNSIDEFENSNQKDFVFFQARAAFGFPVFLKTAMLHFSYMNYYFYSPAYYKILWLENLVYQTRSGN
jgi:hypothetical protein